MDSLIDIFSGKHFRNVLAKWNTCTKRRREEMEASNPDSSPPQEFSGSSSMRSSKIRPFNVESNYAASSSTSNNPFMQKKTKITFNEMVFTSQGKNSYSTNDSSGKINSFQARTSASLKFFPPNEKNLEPYPGPRVKNFSSTHSQDFEYFVPPLATRQ